MTFKTLVLALAVATTGAALAAGDDHKPRHGGIVVEGKVFDLEVVAKSDLIQVYPGDHGKPMKADGAKGKVTLLNGAEKSEVELAPAGDKLEAKGNFKITKGTKGIVSVTLAGKPAVTGRFEIR